MKKLFLLIILTFNCSGGLLLAQCGITLTSTQATIRQTLCDTFKISNVIYNITGPSGYMISGLPLGVSDSLKGSVLTISGTPKQFGTFNYKIRLTSCADSASGTLIVRRPLTINNLTDQSVCSGNTIPAIKFRDSLNTNTIFKWTGSTPAIGLPLFGADDIAPFNAVNTTAARLVDTITVTPTTLNGYAYIANYSSSNVSVIDLANNKLVQSIHVGKNPFGVSVSPNGSRVYVVDIGLKNVFVINTFTNRVVDSIPVGSGPACALVSPDGNRLYVTNTGDSTVSVIRTDSNKVITKVRIGTTKDPHPFGLAITPDGKRLYVTNPDVDTIAVINTDSNKVSSYIYVGLASKYGSSAPEGIAISPDGSKLYVGNENYSYISVINSITNTEAKRIYLKSYGPTGVTISPAGDRLYVADFASNDISVINTLTDTLITTINVGNYPIGTSINADGTRVYVVCKNSNNLYVISTVTNAIVDSVAVGLQPWSFGNFIMQSGSCSGVSKTFKVVVDPIPNVAVTPITQLKCSGDIDTIILTGKVNGTVFNWTRNKSGILPGIPASGKGNIFGILIDTIGEIVTDTFAIIPTAGTCTGESVQAMVRVKPKPFINEISSAVYCNRDNVNGYNFSSRTPESIITWSSGLNIGFGTHGGDFIPPFTAVNPDNHPVTAQVIISIAADKCPGPDSVLSITVNPSPLRPDFHALSKYSDADTLNLCRSTDNVNFNVNTPLAGLAYHWYGSDQRAHIKDVYAPNTVISFPETGTYTVTLTDLNSYGCMDSATQTVIVNAGDGFSRAGIFMKQPGNILIYPDNSLNTGDGYQWGYDSLLQAAPVRRYGAPVAMAGQVYQYFIPDKRFLNANNQVDTSSRAFWVLLKKGACSGRVYYNGPYVKFRSVTPITEDNAITLAAVPNPSDGHFDISLRGNIYGNVRVAIFNAVGQTVFNTDFTKTVAAVSRRLDTGFLPDGLYYMEIRSSDLKSARTRFMIRH